MSYALLDESVYVWRIRHEQSRCRHGRCWDGDVQGQETWISEQLNDRRRCHRRARTWRRKEQSVRRHLHWTQPYGAL